MKRNKKKKDVAQLFYADYIFVRNEIYGCCSYEIHFSFDKLKFFEKFRSVDFPVQNSLFRIMKES